LQLKEQFKDRLSTLEIGLARMADMERSESLWNLHGRQPIMSRARRMIAGAEKSVYLVAWAEELQSLKADLETAVNRGLRLVIISCGDTGTMPGIHYCHAFEEDIVRVETGSINLVVDGQEVLVGATQPPDDCYAFWSHNTDLVLVTEEYIRHEVYLHKIIERFGENGAEALQSAFADGLQEIPYE
jgi:sugar-specific transcriptional regulator TrmB